MMNLDLKAIVVVERTIFADKIGFQILDNVTLSLMNG